MLKTFLLSFLILSFLVSCRGIRTIPDNYADQQKRERSILAVFLDGTRDKPHRKEWKKSHVQNTHALLFTGIGSLYVEGVGAGNRLRQAATGATTKERIMKAYRFLAENYKAGDSICLFGFSRGANQCRILASLIYSIGIIDLEKIKGSERQSLLLDLYAIYDTAAVSAKKIKLAEFLNRWDVVYDTSGTTMIELIGLWDTVEALKIGDTLETTTPIPPHFNQLYNVKKLYHALSLDDNRAYNYSPILATHKEVALHPQQSLDSIVEEVWFNGCHKDVGGGVGKKKRDQLSGISLEWMLSKLKPYHLFRDTIFQPNIYGAANDMRAGLFKYLSPGDTLRGINKYWQAMDPGWNKHRIKVHESVITRLDSGVVAEFKLKKGRAARLDWYDWEPFATCFTKVIGKRTVRVFRKDDCSCIEVVK